jgi:hypothetical protein
MRRLLALSLIALSLLAPAAVAAQSPADADKYIFPADCDAADLTVVCGLIPPWGNGEYVWAWSDVKNDAIRKLELFPENERPWRLCLKGEFGPEWSLRPCADLAKRTPPGFSDFTEICVGHQGVHQCLLGDLKNFKKPVHFVWDKDGLEVISEGTPVEFEKNFTIPDDCGAPYTICGLLPPWGNTMQIERVVPFDRAEGFTLVRESVLISQADDVWRLCTDPRLGEPVWSLDRCAQLEDGAGLHAVHRGMPLHDHEHPHHRRSESSNLPLLLALLLVAPAIGAVAIVRALADEPRS